MATELTLLIISKNMYTSIVMCKVLIASYVHETVYYHLFGSVFV